MENSVAGTTLWSDYPLGIVSQGETDGASTLVSSDFRRPYTEVEAYPTSFRSLFQPLLAFFFGLSFLASRRRCLAQGVVFWQVKQNGQIHPPH